MALRDHRLGRRSRPPRGTLQRCPTCEHDPPAGIVALMEYAQAIGAEELVCKRCGAVWGFEETQGE